MATIRFIREDLEVQCNPGENLRELVMKENLQLYGLKGILGNCGGAGQCSTCFVSVEGGNKNSLSPLTSVEALGRIIIFNGFMEGKWTPDVAFIIAEPVMKMIATMGLTAGVEKIRMSMTDITNNEQIQSIARTKVNAEETAQAAKGVKQDIKKIEKKGLMAKPNKEEMQ